MPRAPATLRGVHRADDRNLLPSLLRRLCAVLGACSIAAVQAGDVHIDAEGCAALGAVPVREGAEYYADLAPLLAEHCGGCHITLSLGGFNLADDQARLALLGADESGAAAGYPGWRRVVPGDPAASLVFLRVNCANAGTPGAIIPPMPPGAVPAPLALQAMVHDWIAAGAIMRGMGPAQQTDLRFRTGFEALR